MSLNKNNKSRNKSNNNNNNNNNKRELSNIYKSDKRNTCDNKKQKLENKNNDGVDDSEWLFWKVFRNKFIYKQIMSNMDTHLSIPYDSIHSVAKMIDNDQLEILRDKVIRNQYLTFYDNTRFDGMERIFVVIKKDNYENILFYQRLFKYYGQYSLDFSNADVKYQTVIMDNETGREELVDRIIKEKCLPALKALIQDYNYNPTIGNYILAIQLGALKFIKLLSQPQFKLSETYKPVPSHEDNTLYSFKSIYHFENENVIDFKSPNESILKRLTKFGMVINKDSKLKRLIQICEVISRSTKSASNKQLFRNANDIEASTSSLTNQELKLSITDKKFHSTTTTPLKREIIKKLLDYYYHHSMIKKPNFYFNYFNNGDHEHGLNGKIEYTSLDFKMAFEFANSKALKHLENGLFELTDNKIPDFLFSNCLDKSKQMEFIDQVIGSLYAESNIIDATLFFYLVIGNDDLDQIRHVSKELTPEFIVVQEFNPYLITRYIKSKLVLDWLFENHLNHFTDNESIWFFTNVELLQHYQRLHMVKFVGTPIILPPLVCEPTYSRAYRFPLLYTPGCFIEYHVLHHIFKSGPVHFQFVEYFESQAIIDRAFRNKDYSCQDKFEICKLDYLNYNGEVIFKPLIYSYASFSMYFIKFLDWLYLNYKSEFLEIKKIYPPPSNYINYILFKIGRYNDDLVSVADGIFDLLYDYKDNIGLLDFILNMPKKKENLLGQTEMFFLLNDIVENNRLKSIEHIHQHHNWVLKKKSSTNPKGILTTDQLNSLLLTSFQNQNLKLTEFLFDLFSITKEEYQSDNKAKVSMVYFRNKTFK